MLRDEFRHHRRYFGFVRVSGDYVGGGDVADGFLRICLRVAAAKHGYSVGVQRFAVGNGLTRLFTPTPVTAQELIIYTSAWESSSAGEYPAARNAACIAALSQEFTLQPRVIILMSWVPLFARFADNIDWCGAVS